MPGPRTLPAIAPMLATGIRDLPRDPEMYAAEFKWDGMRILASVRGGEVLLRSRTGRDVTSAYPELGILGELAGRRQLVLDGEVVAFHGGRPDFGRLQRRMHVPAPRAELTAAVPVTYLLFDVLYRGSLLIYQPYAHRRAVLEGLGLHAPGLVEVPPAFPGDAGAVAAAAATLQLEGVVLKRLLSRYAPGKRSRDWLKLKHLTAGDVIIGGWIPRPPSRLPGALLIGAWAERGLEFAGTVVSGLPIGEARQLGQLLEMLRVPRSPFRWLPGRLERAALFAEPVLAGEVAYAQVGARGVMRHPVWRGLRPG